MPEKYFTPASELSLHEASLSSMMESGAPRPVWKLTFHEPSSVASSFFCPVEMVRLDTDVGLRKTTKTLPQGSRSSGTVVRPPAILKLTGSDLPVSACQSSGSLPVTRKVASTL